MGFEQEEAVDVARSAPRWVHYRRRNLLASLNPKLGLQNQGSLSAFLIPRRAALPSILYQALDALGLLGRSSFPVD